MVGTADSPAADPLGFFLIPADPESNNLRVYVVAAATRAVYPLEPLARSTSGSAAPRAGRTAPPPSPLRCFQAASLRWLTR